MAEKAALTRGGGWKTAGHGPPFFRAGAGGQLLGQPVEHDAPVTHPDHPVAVAPRGIERVQVGDDGAAVHPLLLPPDFDYAF